MQQNDQEQLIALAAVEATARKALENLAKGNLAKAIEAQKTMRPIAEAGLGSELLIKIGAQINAGTFEILNTAIDQMLDQFIAVFNCSPEQARLCLAYAVLNPDKRRPKAPRLATASELRRGNKKKNRP